MFLIVACWLWSSQIPETPSALSSQPDGWVDLLAEAGPELKGWTRLTIPPGSQLAERSQWSVDKKTGYLVCEGDGGHEWLRYDKEFGDFTYHAEWRFTPAAKPGYNSGIYVRNSTDATIWHQVQIGSGSGGYLFAVTAVGSEPKRINFQKELKAQRIKDAGEWNVVEVICKGKDITVWANGAVTNEWHDCEVPKGFVGVEAEGFRIEFRNLKIKPL